MILVPVARVPRVYADPFWHRYVWLCWVTALLTGPLSLLQVFLILETWTGTLQHMSMAVPFLWVEITALRMPRTPTQFACQGVC